MGALGFAGELDTDVRRRRYIAGFHGHRFASYEYALGRRTPTGPVHFFTPNPVPTLVLYGPEDRVVPRDFLAKATIAFPERIGPFVVPGAGHLLQWETASVLNQALAYFLRDLTRR